MAAHMAANLPADLRAPRRASLAGGGLPRARSVPGPAAPGRLRRRGFDPAALLAAGLAARTGLPLAACLRRADRGRRQVGAGRSARRSAGRFVAVATRAAAARGGARRRRPHHRRDARRLRPRAARQRGAEWVGAVDLCADAVNGL